MNEIDKICVTSKTLKALKLYNIVKDKMEFHYKKYDKARKIENIDFHYNKYKIYRDIRNRVNSLSFKIGRNKKFGDGREWFEQTAQQYKKMRSETKKERCLEFESNYRVSLHFFQNSLGADYGTFTCDRCTATFYHSPSNIYLGIKKIHYNCCGNCVNSLLRINGQEEVFQ